MRLEDELVLYDCNFSAEKFRELLTEVWTVMFPEWAVGADQILYRPYAGLQYCEVIRARTKSPLADQMILRRAVNLRKYTPESMRVEGGEDSAESFPQA